MQLAQPKKRRKKGSTVRVTDPALFPLCIKLIELGFFVWEKDGQMASEQGISTLCAHHTEVPNRIIVLVNNPPHFSGVILQDLRGVQIQAVPCLEPHVVQKIASSLTSV
jgi:hypothetical protein